MALADVSGWRLAAELDRLRRAHDVVLIDSPPQVATDARLAVRGADLVLVPVQPSPPDPWAAEGTLKLASAEQPACADRAQPRPAAGRLRAGVEAEIARQGFGVFTRDPWQPRPVSRRPSPPGSAITEALPRSTAAAELRALLAEIEGVLR